MNTPLPKLPLSNGLTPPSRTPKGDTICELGRIQRTGASFCMIIPRAVCAALGWVFGDRVAIRQIGDVMVIERIPMERLALLRHRSESQHVQP